VHYSLGHEFFQAIKKQLSQPLYIYQADNDKAGTELFQNSATKAKEIFLLFLPGQEEKVCFYIIATCILIESRS